MNDPNFSTEFALQAAKGTPPVAIGAVALSGVPLEQWVFIATLIYLGLQIVYLLWKWVREAREDKRDAA